MMKNDNLITNDGTPIYVRQIKELCEINQFTQSDLADKSGLATGTISNVLSGKVEPRIGTMIQIAKALNTSVDNLIGYSTPKDKEKIEEATKMLVNAVDEYFDVVKRIRNASARLAAYGICVNEINHTVRS